MGAFEDSIHSKYDDRFGTLAKIKARSIGADALVLSAMNVLSYAQLEGGIKDLASYIIKEVNRRNLNLGDISPALLQWRNSEELDRYRNLLNFELIGSSDPFRPHLSRKTVVRPINRRGEFNQMNWPSLMKLYTGFRLNSTAIQGFESAVGDLVSARNTAAHHGLPPPLAATMLELQLRGYVVAVEGILTDLSLQMLTFFSNRLHLR